MRKLLIIVFVFLLNTKISFSKIISATNILENLDICKTSSSLGPRCKESNFNYKNFFNSGKKTISKNTVYYEVDEWNYYFEIIEATENKTTIKFTDKAKYATYHNVSLITLVFNKSNLKWDIASNITIYPK